MTDEPKDEAPASSTVDLGFDREIPESVRKPFRATLYDLFRIIIVIIAGLASMLGGFLALRGLTK